jgi:hypothetical protein
MIAHSDHLESEEPYIPVRGLVIGVGGGTLLWLVILGLITKMCGWW